MPDILIDIGRLLYRRRKGRPSTGIDRVGLEYIRHYADRARAVLALGPFSSVLSVPESARAFRLLLESYTISFSQAMYLILIGYFRWWVRPDVSNSILLNADHTGLDHAGYARAITRKGARTVFVVSDLIPISHPEYFWPGESERHLKRMRAAVARADGIVAISRDTLAALTRFAAAAKLRMPPAVAAPIATNVLQMKAGPRPFAEPYFVVVGTIEPRKNHLLLLQLWRRLVERLGQAAPRLVIIGQRGWECENVVDHLERCAPLQGFVFERSGCSDEALVTCLHHAQALLFPSFVEGFGLPLAEALSLGTPAIASDLPVFREVAGDVPEYVDPVDGQRWMELIAEYADPRSARRMAQIERMKNFSATTWQQHFRIVDDFIESLK